jgi:DNA invertase Pin-like site-specific DNA recombinase
MHNGKITAALVRSAAGGPDELAAQEEHIRAAAHAEGQAIDQVFRDAAELRRAVEGGEIGTLWLTSLDRIRLNAKGIDLMEALLGAGVTVRTAMSDERLDSTTSPIVLTILRAMAAQRKEERATAIKRGKEEARLRREA